MSRTVAPRPAADAAGPVSATAPAAETRTKVRVRSIDIVRGLSIAIMLLAVHPGPRAGLPEQLTHPDWHGVNFADLFFPLFLFAMGASMPFSASASTPKQVARRTLVLFGIGVALVSLRSTDLVIPGVLQHLAIAYAVAWLVLRTPRRVQWAICGAALVAYWVAFLVVADGDPWSKASGFAHTANGWVFGGFRTEGWPQSVTSFVNVMAGVFVARRLVEGEHGRDLLKRVSLWAVGLIALGLALSPWIALNKFLWTPSFAILTAGTSCAWFALAYWVADHRGHHRLTQPLVALGSNAIAVYVLFIGVPAALARHRGPLDDLLPDLAPTPLALAWSAAWLLLGWWFCHVLYQRRIFIRV